MIGANVKSKANEGSEMLGCRDWKEKPLRTGGEQGATWAQLDYRSSTTTLFIPWFKIHHVLPFLLHLL